MESLYIARTCTESPDFKRESARLDDKCDIIGMYVELSRCEELEKIRLFQPLRAKDFLESRMHPYLIAGIERLKRISDKTTEAFAERHASTWQTLH